MLLQSEVFSIIILLLFKGQAITDTSSLTSTDDSVSICIDKYTGNDTSQCLEANSDNCCATLDFVLNETVNTTVSPYSNDTSISLYINSSGNHPLKNSYSIQHMKGFAIIAANDTVNVICDDGAGLSFLYSSNIIIKGITMYKCGAPQNSSNCDIFDSTFDAPKMLKYHVAVYFSFCRDILVSQMNFTATLGTSVGIYNTVGVITINNCTFKDSTQHERYDEGGGGGLQIEFSFCPPGVSSTNCDNDIPREYSSNSKYFITDNSFTGNHAFRGNSMLYSFNSLGQRSYNFGNGAGLSLVVKGKASGNQFLIKDCKFEDNWAHYGGGFYIAFFDKSNSNLITITNANVTNNMNYDARMTRAHWDLDATGGGGMILYQSGKLGKNRVLIQDSLFQYNTGNSGGGLSVQGISYYGGHLNGSLDIVNVTFKDNSAYLGSAIYLYHDNVFNQGNNNEPFLAVSLNDSLLIGNIPLCLKTGPKLLASLPCTGIIYASNQPLTLAGLVNFTNNQGSTLQIHYTTVSVLNDSRVYFFNNTGIKGAGISLYDCSYITINYNTTFVFIKNIAEQGPAIYSDHCTSGEAQTAALSSNCFLTYYDEYAYPDNWNTSFIFINNSDYSNQSHVMYIRSLVSCYWPNDNEYLVRPNETFSWKPFDYSGNGDDYTKAVKTDISYMSYRDLQIIPHSPGQPIPVPDLFDGRNVSVDKELNHTILKACILDDTSPMDLGRLTQDCTKGCVSFSTNNPVSLYYCQNLSDKAIDHNHVINNTYTNLAIKTNSKIQVSIKIYFANCTYPYHLVHNYCALEIDYFCCENTSVCNSGISCDINSILHPKLSYCVSKLHENDYIIGRCPVSYGNLTNAFKYSSIKDKEQYFCNNSRNGLLCGQCQQGTSLAVNSIYFKCINCSDKKIWQGWLYLIFIQFIPQTIAVLLIVLFNIKLAVGIVSGFILYCQVMTIQLPGWYYPPFLALSDGSHVGNDEDTFYVTSTYSIVNMRFLTFLCFDWKWQVCLSNNMNALGVVSFWYIVAFYPIILFLFIGLWLFLYDRGVWAVVKVTVPLHQCLARFWHFFKIEPSLVQSSVSVYILSLMELISISSKLLHYTTWQSLNHKDLHGRSFYYDANMLYFGWPHAFFGLFAFLILFFFVFLPMVFLLFYQFSWFHRLLFRCKLRFQWCVMVGDVFTGPFKDGTKNRVDFGYISGLYILFRLVTMLFFYIEESRYVLISEIALSLLYAAFIMIFRPFRSTLINFAEFIIFFNLALMATLCLAFNSIGRNVSIYGVMHIPTLLIVLLVIVNLYKRGKSYYETRKSRRSALKDLESLYDDESDIEDFNVPDRVLNPSKYLEEHVPYSPAESTVGDRADQISLPYLPIKDDKEERRENCSSSTVSLRASIRNTDSDYGTQ